MRINGPHMMAIALLALAVSAPVTAQTPGVSQSSVENRGSLVQGDATDTGNASQQHSNMRSNQMYERLKQVNVIKRNRVIYHTIIKEEKEDRCWQCGG